MILASGGIPELSLLISDLIFDQIEIHTKTVFENVHFKISHLYSIIVSLELTILYKQTIDQSAVDEMVKEIPMSNKSIATAMNLVFKFDENFKQACLAENGNTINPDVIYGMIIYSILKFQKSQKYKTNDFEALCKLGFLEHTL